MFTTEYFGPILSVHVYDDSDYTAMLRQAAEVSPYALTGAVIARDRAAIAEASDALRFAAGNFYINDKPTGAVVGQQPFGGARASGTNDKAGSILNLTRWVSARTIKELFSPPSTTAIRTWADRVPVRDGPAVLADGVDVRRAASRCSLRPAGLTRLLARVSPGRLRSDRVRSPADLPSGPAGPGRRPAPAAAAAGRPPLRGVIADWGGVMTNPITETVRAWIAADEIDYDSYHAVMKAWVTGAYDVAGEDNPIHVLERGECSNEEFERMLAAQIVRRDGLPVAAEGLLDRMFAATVLSEPMQDLLRRVRRAGLKTAMLSNSWGISAYPADLLADLFDAVVISAEVGMRKPEERIFRHAAGLLGLDPAECVFIDDIEANVQAAEALGMTGVLHTGPAATAARLASLLGLS